MNALRAQKKDEVSVVLCGEAGQGIQTAEQILARCLKLSGFHVFATKEYMSRVRGGSNSTEIRISSKRISAYLDRIDILIPFHQGAIKHVEKRITPETIVLGDKEIISKDFPLEVKEFIDIPFSKIASDIGGKIYVNIIAAGVVLGTVGVEQHLLTNFIREFFSKKSEDVIKRNIEAIKKGYEVGTQILNSGKIEFTIRSSPRIKNENLLNGAEAVGLGALAGGCKFLSSYPMSPSTGVMVFLSQQMEDFDIVVEQAEDEISAINMAIGASYSGARSMVTTSGGGFALMIEGVSLAGMLEIPVVIHLGQRPGPATGLPTRTEQADLELALYSGHGEFPRIILAPGNLKDAFFLTQKAFNLADKYQIPVFVLTDQYLIDSLMNLPLLDISDTRDENHVVKTHKGYKRYELTEDGISPRGIPGFGEGLVGVDSDEHDEEAHITEDLIIREKMVDKRLKKLDSIKKEIVPPELVGSTNYKVLITGWGSTDNVVREALQELGREDISFLHFKQVYPLYEGTRDYLQKAQKNIIIENNATSQFGKLIKLYTGVDIEAKILKYNGLAFSVEEVVAEIKKILSKEKI
ncbi:MAG: 2-oxoacid:acceptor oxidoreductase subunit alpha [Candidatus Aminicenantes bacterium]|nr:MAG: 2-oxoacid:acceptor oxidoreductase subunit alpha [Candidatus Aminicenantes bacterium]